MRLVDRGGWLCGRCFSFLVQQRPRATSYPMASNSEPLALFTTHAARMNVYECVYCVEYSSTASDTNDTLIYFIERIL